MNFPPKNVGSAMTNQLDSDSFRRALGSFTTGVTVVTTHDQAAGVDVGLTANSFNSVSLDPPMVLWSLARSARSLDAFVNAEYFAVHILAADQEDLSGRFARRGEDKFAGLTLERGPGNVPLLDRYAARFVCRTAFQYEGGDHEIFVGEVVAFEHTEAAPLIFHGGQYGMLLKKVEEVEPDRMREQVSNFGQDFLGYLLGRAYQQLFAPIRTELRRRGLNVTEYYVLSLAARFEQITLEGFNAKLASTDHVVTPELLAGLRAQDLLASVDTTAGTGWELTRAGRQLLIELVSVAKAVESDAVSELDYDERQNLKLLLRQVIRSTRDSPADSGD